MTDRELMQLALEALTHLQPTALTSFYTIGDRDKAIAALREKLAQPETEAEIYKRLYELRGKALDRPCSRCGYQPKRIYPMAQPEQSRAEKMRDAGYTRRPTLREIASKDEQPEQEQAESITDAMMNLADRLGSEFDLVDPRAWEHLLVYAPKQPKQEPVAICEVCEKARPVIHAPRREWQGLTEEEVENFVSALWPVGVGAGKLLRAIEAKLKEKNA